MNIIKKTQNFLGKKFAIFDQLLKASHECRVDFKILNLVSLKSGLWITQLRTLHAISEKLLYYKMSFNSYSWTHSGWRHLSGDGYRA